MILHREQPVIFLVQNPSIVLTLLAILLKPIYKYKLIVDAHNAGLMPTKNILNPLKKLYSLIQKKADLTIVTNEKLADLVKNNGGSPYVLPDRIPEVDFLKKKPLRGKASVIYICTFGKDEPYEEVIKAAEKLDRNIYIYITGNCNRPKILAKEAPPNVIFTGYLPEEEYWTMLYSANLTLDLTLRKNCLVCGAYESTSVGVPMILSDTKALKDYFYKGAVFTQNDPISISNSIMEALQKEILLGQEIKELKKELSSLWESRVKAILQYLEA